MKLLVINSGSSSLKYQLIDMETEGVLAKGNCERIGIPGSKLTHKANGKEKVVEKEMPDHNVAVALVLDALTDKEVGVIASMSEKEVEAVTKLFGGVLKEGEKKSNRRSWWWNLIFCLLGILGGYLVSKFLL